MANILQFLHTNQLFPTRGDAITYIDLNRPDPLASIIAEPIVVKYGTNEATASIILGIGTNTKYFYFDTDFLQEEIDTINTTVSSTGTEITTIKTDIATIQSLLNTVITASGLNSNGTYNPTVGGATSLANADALLLNQINTLIANLNSGVQKTHPVISTVSNNLIYSEIDNGIAVKIDSFSYEPTTGVLTLSFNNVTTPYTVNLGLNVIGFQSITFDSTTESLIIIYQTTGGGTQTVTVPVSGMFSKWEVDNPITNAVVLTKTLGGVGGVDKLSGDVKVDTTYPHNILQKNPVNGSLYATGVSDNISFNGTSQNVTDKINSIALDISNAAANAVSNANVYTNTQIAQEVINRNNAIANGVNAANTYTDGQVSVVSNQLSNIQNVVIPAEVAARQNADNALQAQINALPTIDTRITSGEVLNNGTLLRLYYGTATSPNMGSFDINTTTYVQNPDQHLTSGIVASDGSTLTINYGTGASQGSIIIPTTTYMDDKHIVSVTLNNGMDTTPVYDPTLTFLHNNGMIVTAHLDALAGAKGINRFQLAPGGGSLLIETFDGTDFNIPLSDFLGNFSTSTEIEAQLALKQDKLIAGSNITIVGNTINSIEPHQGTVTSIIAGNGLSGGTITSTGTIALNAATTATLGGVIVGSGINVTGGTISLNVASVPQGTVTSVTAGGGMDFSAITASGAVALGTPSTIGPNTSNAVSGNTHTHNVALGFNISDYSTTNQVANMITNATSNVMVNATLMYDLNVNAVSQDLNMFKLSLATNTLSYSTIVMPIATNTNNGYMPYQDHVSIQKLQTDVLGLLSAGGRFVEQSFPTKAALLAWIVPPTVNPGDFTYVQADETQTAVAGKYPTVKYMWSTAHTWTFVIIINEGSYPIATTGYIGLVKGSTANGQSYVETDGTMSLNGYDVIVAHMANTSNPHNVTKAQVGLGNADNTSDINKPISTATQAALDLKAPLANPALTGIPTAPNAAVNTNTNQIATTNFVQTQIATTVPVATNAVQGKASYPNTGGLVVSSGAVSINTPATGLAVTAGQLTLNPATATTIGGVSVGARLNITGSLLNVVSAPVADSANAVTWANVSGKPFNSVSFTNGISNATGIMTMGIATTAALGSVFVPASPAGLSINATSGAVTLNIASTTALGGVYIPGGNGLSINAAGAVAMSVAGTTSGALGSVYVPGGNGLSLTSGAIAMANATATVSGAVLPNTSAGLTYTSGVLGVTPSAFYVTGVTANNGLSLVSNNVAMAIATGSTATTPVAGAIQPNISVNSGLSYSNTTGLLAAIPASATVQGVAAFGTGLNIVTGLVSVNTAWLGTQITAGETNISGSTTAAAGNYISGITFSGTSNHTLGITQGTIPIAANLTSQSNAFSQAMSNGVATTWARSDHYHPIPAETTLSGGGTAAVGNYVNSVTGSGHVLSIGQAVLPTLSGGGTAAAGNYVSGVTVSGYAVTVSQLALPAAITSLALTKAVGANTTTLNVLTDESTATNAMRYKALSGAGATTVTTNATNVIITSPAIPTAANLTGQASAYGQVANNGVATTWARSDHYHALPAIYSLPTATASVLGGVMVGSGINVAANGQISLNVAAIPGTGVTSITQGAGIICTPNPITGTGTIAVNTTYIQAMIDASLANLVGVAPII